VLVLLTLLFDVSYVVVITDDVDVSVLLLVDVAFDVANVELNTVTNVVARVLCVVLVVLYAVLRDVKVLNAVVVSVDVPMLVTFDVLTNVL
jgi:hypothetical protein